MTGASLVVERGQRLAPSIAVLGHVLVAPPVGLTERQAAVYEEQHRYLRLAVLAQQLIEQGVGCCLFGHGEERHLGLGIEAGEYHASGHIIPVIDLVEDVEPREPSLPARGDRFGIRRAERHSVPLPAQQ